MVDRISIVKCPTHENGEKNLRLQQEIYGLQCVSKMLPQCCVFTMRFHEVDYSRDLGEPSHNQRPFPTVLPKVLREASYPSQEVHVPPQIHYVALGPLRICLTLRHSCFSFGCHTYTRLVHTKNCQQKCPPPLGLTILNRAGVTTI